MGLQGHADSAAGGPTMQPWINYEPGIGNQATDVSPGAASCIPDVAVKQIPSSKVRPQMGQDGLSEDNRVRHYRQGPHGGVVRP